MNIVIAARPSENTAFAVGLALLAPSLLFLMANILNALGIDVFYAPLDAVLSEPHMHNVFNIVLPAVFLGGIGLALLLNLLAIAELDLQWDGTRVVSTVTIEPRALSLVLIVISGLMLAIFAAYAFVENQPL